MKNIRKNIIKENNTLYFDYAASGQAYKKIEKKLRSILKTYANTHSENSYNAIKTQQYYKNARESIKKSLSLDDSFYVLPAGNGATGAIKKFQEIMGLYLPPQTKARFCIEVQEKPLVIVGPYEHHSNEVSFREALCDVVRIKLNDIGGIDFNELERVLEQNANREIIASFNLASNVTGIITDYKRIYKIIKKYNGIVALDGAAVSAHINVDCKFFDALYLSPHKLLGGPGSCGILIIKKNLYKGMIPTFACGGTVSYVSRVSHFFLNDVETIEDGGTPGILQFIKASLAYELRNKIGLKSIRKVENKLKRQFGKAIKAMEKVHLYCSFAQDKVPIFALNIDGISAYKIAEILSEKYQIQTRAGCSCAGPYGHDLLELKDNQSFDEKPGWLRISLHFTHTKDEVNTLLRAIEEISLSI